MTTNEAFAQLVNKRAWYVGTGITEDEGSNLKARFKLGKVSLEKQIEVLKKAGFRVVQEMDWGLPNEDFVRLIEKGILTTLGLKND